MYKQFIAHSKSFLYQHCHAFLLNEEYEYACLVFDNFVKNSSIVEPREDIL